MYNFTYNNETIEGAINNYNLTLFNTNITTGTFYYNNTTYSTIKTTYPYYTTFSKSLTLDLINTPNIINEMFWEVGLNTSRYNQTVYNLDIDNCLTYSDLLINYTIKDENNLTNLNPSSIQTDIIITDTNSNEEWQFSNISTTDNLQICLPSGLLNILNNTYTIDIVSSYVSDNYVQEFWYLDNGLILDNGYFNAYTPTTINLYDLPSTDSTTFLFNYYDTNSLSVDNAIVHTYRKYIGEGIFREVERSKQDNNGETHVHLIEEDAIYYFVISQYGEILYTSDTYNAKCLSSPCTIELKASSEFQEFPTDWEVIDDTYFTINTNKTTRITTLYFESNTTKDINFSLYSYDGDSELLLTNSTSSTTGSLSLTIPITYDNTSYFGAIYIDDSFAKSEWIDLTPSGQDMYGSLGPIIAGFLVLCVALISITEGVLMIIFICVALLLMGILMLIDLAWITIISLMCAGGLIIWKIIKNRNG